MSEQLTTIELPGRHVVGYSDYGCRTVAEMLALIRQYAEHTKRQAEIILAAKDTDFRVYQHRGVHVRRERVVLQEGALRGTREGETP